MSYLQLFHKNFNRLKCVIGSKTVKTKTFSTVFFYCFGGGNLINSLKSSVLLDIKNGVVFRIIQNERQRTWVALKGTFDPGQYCAENIRRKRIKTVNVRDTVVYFVMVGSIKDKMDIGILRYKRKPVVFSDRVPFSAISTPIHGHPKRAAE